MEGFFLLTSWSKIMGKYIGRARHRQHKQTKAELIQSAVSPADLENVLHAFKKASVFFCSVQLLTIF